MFTGIVTDKVRVRGKKDSPRGLMVRFANPPSWDAKLGDSVSIDGICLTVDFLKSDEWTCVIMPETLSVTTFGKKVPDVVNLERSMKVQGRFDGHFVQGHVDDVGRVTKVDETNGFDLYIQFDPKNLHLVVKKGSIAVNGVSLTIADIADNEIRVSLIPHTITHTNLGDLKPGDLVNIEYDVIGKYVNRIMEARESAES
jgi:riboflavin synthase